MLFFRQNKEGERGFFASKTLPDGAFCFVLGTFDGVHIAHVRLLETCKAVSDGKGLIPAAFVIEDDRPGAPPLVCSTSERIARIFECGISLVVHVKLSEISKLSPSGFVSMLSDMGGRAAVCGENFRFGANRIGDAKTLTSLIETTVLPSVKKCGNAISASEIRSAVMRADMQTARQMLGREYAISGVVVHGNKIGRNLSFPTANISLPDGCVEPLRGVYASAVLLDNLLFPAVTNIGVKPTVGDANTISVETHLLRSSPDLYEREICVQLLCFMRSERKFASLEELRTQALSDIAAARKYHGLNT